MGRPRALTEENIDEIMWIRKRGQAELRKLEDEKASLEEQISKIVDRKKALRKTYCFETLGVIYKVSAKTVQLEVDRRLNDVS